MKNHLNKSGEGPGGKFNGPSVKHIIIESSFKQLEELLPIFPTACEFTDYLRTLRFVHEISVSKNFDPTSFDEILLVFGQQFQVLKEKHGLSETLKVHVITSHFGQYFQKMGTNFCHTNGENLESAHSSLRISEERHGLKMVRKIGTPRHGAMSERSLIFYNSKRAKMTPPLRRIRSAANSPVSSPIYLQ